MIELQQRCCRNQMSQSQTFEEVEELCLQQTDRLTALRLCRMWPIKFICSATIWFSIKLTCSAIKSFCVSSKIKRGFKVYNRKDTLMEILFSSEL